MTLHSRMLDVCKRVDAVAGMRWARLTRGRRPLPPTPPQDALLIRLWGLGNLTLLAPLLSSPARPRLRLLTLRRNADFMAQHFPSVGLLTVPEPHQAGFLPAVLRVARTLRRDAPQVIVDLEQFLRLPLLLARSACPAPAVGLDTPGQGRGPLLDRAVAADPTRHVADTFRAVCRAAGLPFPRGHGGLQPAPASLRFVQPLIGSGASAHIVIHPGTGDHFPGRRWPADRFADLAGRLERSCRARILITGVRSERRLAAQVCRAAGPNALNLAGQLDIAQLVALIARADLVVTNDTAPLHLAETLGTAAVALYGPNSPHRCGPRRPGSRALWADLPCSPCLDDRSMRSSSCRHFACMDALPVPAVYQACLQALAPHGRPSRRVQRAIPR